MDNKELIAMLRKQIPNDIANELVGVQPMPSDIGQRLMEEGMSEKDLIEQGYEPVSGHRLMWIKKDQ